MKKLLLILGAVLAVACADVDDDFEADTEMLDAADAGAEKAEPVTIGIKSQALGTACPYEVYVPLAAYDSSWNNSGWTGSRYLNTDTVSGGVRTCKYYAPEGAVYRLGKTLNPSVTSCTAIANTGNKRWKCKIGFDYFFEECPGEATASNPPVGFRQTNGGAYQPWSNAGATTVFQWPGLTGYVYNSGTYDSANKRIWCGYPQWAGQGPWSFYRSEGF